VNPLYVTATRLWFNEAESLRQSMMPFRATDRVASYAVGAGVEMSMEASALIDGDQAAVRSN
jgi:hypothetical protein